MAPEERVDVEFQAQLDALHQLYGKLPSVNCKGLCWNSCGPIDLSTAERRRIVEWGVEIPVFTEERSQRWAADEPLYCPALEHNPELPGGVGCSVYNDRPLICRIWGVGEDDLACPHGCETTGTLTHAEVMDLLMESFKIGGHENFSDADAEQANETLQAALADPKVGPLMRRFMQGDRSVLPQLQDWLRSR